MKKILILLILVSFACKKKKVEPEPEPDPVVPTCQTGVSKFAGKYKDPSGNVIEIIFVSNNCPAQNANKYTVKGLAAVVNAYSADAFKIENTDYTAQTTESKNSNSYSNIEVPLLSGGANRQLTISISGTNNNELNVEYNGVTTKCARQ